MNPLLAIENGKPIDDKKSLYKMDVAEHKMSARVINGVKVGFVHHGKVT